MKAEGVDDLVREARVGAQADLLRELALIAGAGIPITVEFLQAKANAIEVSHEG
jgi:hypothetical protein